MEVCYVPLYSNLKPYFFGRVCRIVSITCGSKPAGDASKRPRQRTLAPRKSAFCEQVACVARCSYF